MSHTPANARVSMGDAMFALRACFGPRCTDGSVALIAVALAWLGTATPAALADEAAAVAVEPEALAPSAPPRRAQIQYGVAYTVEVIPQAGPVCANQDQPCILGSGGGIDVSVGWRPTDAFYGSSSEAGGGRSCGVTPGHGWRDAESEEPANAIVVADGICGHEAQFA